MSQLNADVTQFLDEQSHPLRAEIEQLRALILSVDSALAENVKWNGPNYTFLDADRITMKIQPPKKIQLIFHCGAKKQEQPKERLIDTSSKFLAWRENDRAIATFANLEEINNQASELKEIVQKWIDATQ